MGWSDLNTSIQAEMHGVSERLKRRFPEYETIILVLPYDAEMIRHLGTEHRATLEKRMAHAASDAFTTYLKEDRVPIQRGR